MSHRGPAACLDSVDQSDPDILSLRDYADTGSQQAFARVVERHVDLVYSAAMRHARDHHLAQDITQAVFLALAAKARQLRNETALAPWLIVATRYAALNAVKSARRRERHEQKAAAMKQQVLPESESWNELSGELDAALVALSSKDRRAIILRYLEGRPVEEVAGLLGISAEAARQRVHRALARMREFLGSRGVEVAASALGPTILAKGVIKAPPDVSSAVTQTIQSATGASVSTLSIAKGALTAMAWTKAKAAVISAAAVLLLAGGTTAVVKLARPKTTQTIVLPAASTQPTSAPASDYVLSPGEVLARVVNPGGAQRKALLGPFGDRNPTSIVVEYDGKPTLQSQTYSSTPGQSLEGLLTSVVGLSTFDFEGPRDLLNWEISGDWVVRPHASVDQRMAALESVLRQQSGRKFHFEKRKVKRDAIIATGTFHFQPIDDPKWKDGVNLYADKLNQPGMGGGATGDVAAFLTDLGSMLHRRVISKVEPSRARLDWRYHNSGDLRYIKQDAEYERRLDSVLENVSRQTGLKFEKTVVDADVWFVSDEGKRVTG